MKVKDNRTVEIHAVGGMTKLGNHQKHLWKLGQESRNRNHQPICRDPETEKGVVVEAKAHLGEIFVIMRIQPKMDIPIKVIYPIIPPQVKLEIRITHL